jgi:hypothetical protein
MAGTKASFLVSYLISEETPMSTSAVSSSALNQSLQQYFQTRHSDLSQLGQALGSGSLSSAQTAFNNIVSLGQSGPFANGSPFAFANREQDFTAIGEALQNGDLAGAQQAFSQLESTFKQQPAPDPTNSAPSSSSASSAGPEIVLNIGGGNSATPEQPITINISNSASGGGNSATPEQPITIDISPSSSGGEQVSLSIGNQGSNPQEITFNLGAASNEQIVLNLLGASSSSTSTSSASAAGSGLSVSA